MRALAEGHGGRGSGILQSSHLVNPGTGGVDDCAHRDVDEVAVDLHLGHGAVAEPDELCAIHHDGARVRSAAQVASVSRASSVCASA